MKTMTSLFSKEARPTGEETETFNARLKPILEQMETLSFHQSQPPFIMFSLLSGPARRACQNLKLNSMKLKKMLSEVCRKVLFDCEVQDRRVTRWSSASFDKFLKQADSEERATRKCLEFVREY